MSVEERLAALGLGLPEPPSPAGAYVPAKRSGNLIFVAGQLPMSAGELKFAGRVGADVSIEEGNEAAKLCALNALSVLNSRGGFARSRRSTGARGGIRPFGGGIHGPAEGNQRGVGVVRTGAGQERQPRAAGHRGKRIAPGRFRRTFRHCGG